MARVVLLLEDELRFQKEIEAAITEFDPQIKLQIFSSIGEFTKWLELLVKSGPAAVDIGPGTPNQLALLISKFEFLGPQRLELLRKTREYFVMKGLCTKEDPTAFVLTGFHDPNFSLKELEDRILNNVIFKPFDKLILSQHLIFAIDGRHPPSKKTIVSQKSDAIIEMLKEIKILDVSEIGFTTNSYREVAPGAVSKYYAEFAATKKVKSFMGVVDKCEADPKKQGEFLLTCRFFGRDPEQISSIRRFLSGNKSKKSVRVGKGTGGTTIKCLVIGEEDRKDVVATLQARFQNLTVYEMDGLKDLYTFIDPKTEDQKAQVQQWNLPEKFDFIFMVIKERPTEIKFYTDTYEQLGKKFDPIPKVYLVLSHDLNDAEEKQLANHFFEAIHSPIDRTLIVRHVASSFPDLRAKGDPIEIAEVTLNQVIKAASPIETTEMSEAGFVMKYYRGISPGSYREVVLWQPYELENTDLLATCNFTQESGTKGTFENHFVFFGPNDEQLKQIRIWIRDRYVDSKQKG